MDTYVYFLYSEQQAAIRTDIDKKISKIFVPGTVIVSGRKQIFTEMSTKPNNSYPDCKVVTEGYKSMMKFTRPYSK